MFNTPFRIMKRINGFLLDSELFLLLTGLQWSPYCFGLMKFGQRTNWRSDGERIDAPKGTTDVNYV